MSSRWTRTGRKAASSSPSNETTLIPTAGMTTTWLALDRAVHFGSCLLFFGVFAFDRLVAAAALAGSGVVAVDYWKSRLQKFTGVLLPVILLSGDCLVPVGCREYERTPVSAGNSA